MKSAEGFLTVACLYDDLYDGAVWMFFPDTLTLMSPTIMMHSDWLMEEVQPVEGQVTVYSFPSTCTVSGELS